MSKVTVKGDNSPTGILKHWERKTRQECAREILRCWMGIEKTKDVLAELRPHDELFGIDFQDEMNSYNCLYCSFEAYDTDNLDIVHDKSCVVTKLRAMVPEPEEDDDDAED